MCSHTDCWYYDIHRDDLQIEIAVCKSCEGAKVTMWRKDVSRISKNDLKEKAIALEGKP